MSAPEEYETEAGLGLGSSREPYPGGRGASPFGRTARHVADTTGRAGAGGRSAGPAGTGHARTGRPRAQAPLPPRWGSLPARRGVVIVLVATAIGAIVTLVMGGGPGAVLGVLLVAGSAGAAFAVDFGQGYLLIPAPALAYAIGATVTGMFHDRGLDISHTALLVSAAQWFAGGFLWMSAATVAVIAITVARWLTSQ